MVSIDTQFIETVKWFLGVSLACCPRFSLSVHVSKPDSGLHERPCRERDGDHMSKMKTVCFLCVRVASSSRRSEESFCLLISSSSMSSYFGTRRYPNIISLKFGLNYTCGVLRSFNFSETWPYQNAARQGRRINCGKSCQLFCWRLGRAMRTVLGGRTRGSSANTVYVYIYIHKTSGPVRWTTCSKLTVISMKQSMNIQPAYEADQPISCSPPNLAKSDDLPKG